MKQLEKTAKINPTAIIEGQAGYISALERRCSYAEKLVEKTIVLERDLGLAKAAISDLKHQLYLIGTEESIQVAIQEHGGYAVWPTYRSKLAPYTKRKAREDNIK